MGSDVFADATGIDGEQEPSEAKPAAPSAPTLPAAPFWQAPPAARAAQWERRCKAVEADARRLRELLAVRTLRLESEIAKLRWELTHGRGP